MRGPVVLTRDARLSGPNVEETISPVVDQAGYVTLTPVSTPQQGIWMQFEAPFTVESHKEGDNKPVPLRLCDYASAGNTLDDQSRFRVWLTQPIDPRRE